MKGSTLTASEAAALIAPGDRVVLGGLSATPHVLISALEERAADLPDLTLMSGMLLSTYSFLGANFENLRYRTWFMPATLGSVQLQGPVVDYLPMAWTQVTRAIADNPADVAIVQVGPPDGNGWCSLGTSTSYTLPAVRTAKLVIAQVNDRMPRTHGDSFVHVSQLDALVPVSVPLSEFPVRPPSDISWQIAEMAADLVAPYVVLQPGIGTLPDAVIQLLHRRGVPGRLVSMVTDGAIDFVRANAVEGRPALTGEVVGSRAVYDFVNDNPAVRMAAADATHSMRALLGSGPFTSVNSALEVDLLGNVNLEFLGGTQAGGIGGSIDFMTAANQPGNLSILVMLATARRGTVSRIRPILAAGSTSIPRSLTQVVVTEYGVADLRGLSVRERAERLIAIAHPDHRAWLNQQWAMHSS